MKVVVLGAGVIGVTSAWYLVQAGHEVTVIDRQPGAALETSFANAGEISPGYSSPWAAPGLPFKAVQWMFRPHPPLIVRPVPDLAAIGWMLDLLGNCTAERYAINKARMVRVAEYSRDCLKALREKTGIQYDERTQGTLEVFRSEKQMAALTKDTDVLKASGVPFEVLDRAGCVRAEPGLAPKADRIIGGLRLPYDETGDCHMFTTRLAEMAAQAGVQFRYETTIRGLIEDGAAIAGVVTDAGEVRADAVVLAMGSYSPHLVKHLGLRVPVYPVKGYSLTLDISDESRAPVSTVMDEAHKVAVTRLGSRIRVGGMAEIAGFADDLPQARRATLEHVVNDLFGGAGDAAAARFWCGFRPMTPDGTPIIGATQRKNLWLNTGHGTLGWTMSCGSGQLLADLISGRPPQIEASDLTLSRYAG